MWEGRATNPFVAGSQGVEYALIAHWRRQGLLPKVQGLPPLLPVDRIAVVSGSCSPVTAAQIAHAEKSGFQLVRVDPLLTLDARLWHNEIERCAAQALEGCRRVVIHLSILRLAPMIHRLPALMRYVTQRVVTVKKSVSGWDRGLAKFLIVFLRKLALVGRSYPVATVRGRPALRWA